MRHRFSSACCRPLLLLFALGLLACPGGSGSNHNQPADAVADGNNNTLTDYPPDPFKNVIEGDRALDDQALLENGPWLHAPAVGSLTVSWETRIASTSRVELTPDGGAPVSVEGITFQQLPSAADSIAIGTVPTTFMHEVVLTDLVPDQAYTYKILSSRHQPTAKLVGPPAADGVTSFVVYGDTRSGHEAHANVIMGVLDYADRRGEMPDFALNTGDLTSSGGSDIDWFIFFDCEVPLISEVPVLGVFGNHDRNEGRTYFEAYFKAPPTSESGNDRYYSAQSGNVFVAVVDQPNIRAEPHEIWLENALAATTAPFKVAAFHYTMFTNSSHDPHLASRANLMPIFEAQGVQLVLAGHNHCYERFVGHGAHYVTTGGGGAGLYGIDRHLDANNEGAVRVSAAKVYHFLWAETTATEMTIRTIIGDDGLAPVDQEFDCFKITAGQPVTADQPCN